MRERHWDPKQTRPGRKPDKPFGARPPKDKSRFAPKPKPVRAPIPDGVAILYGWHPVAAALRNPQRTIRRIFATENAAHRLAEDGIALPVAPEIVRPEAIAARLTPDATHQGVLAEADALPALELEDVAAHGTVLVLDQITDPHNVGAILRSAAAFGARAVIVTARHSP
jgi:23S rRNA (guanosine2251-2'-O)-methyltransferase